MRNLVDELAEAPTNETREASKGNFPPRQVWAGTPYPLGATATGKGVNFALFSENAEAVELCLFDKADGAEIERIKLRDQDDMVWHVFVPDIKAGQLYGYRVYGKYAPNEGARFNSAKLVLDPYAKAFSGPIRVCEEMFGYSRNGENNNEDDANADERDDAASMPKCVVIDPAFDWKNDQHPATPLHESVIYEVHVRGFSKLCPEIPENLRGTFAGLGSEPAISYFKKLGVTALQLLPVQQHVDSFEVVQRGLTNYWGYDLLGYLAPHSDYASEDALGDQVREFKAMVLSLHKAGIEVILDVGYDHTGEGNHLGPTLSFRGIDNAAYYRLAEDNRRCYKDLSGMGNTFDIVQPRVLQLVMDSLRYWVTEMHVDGFRFDQASALARNMQEADRLGIFFDTIHQDPVLSVVKLIAEPLSMPGGERIGSFPVLWAENNLRYKHTVRKYWRGDSGNLGELAYRLSGSSDLYQLNGKRPYASINAVASHDGFTLSDLVSYDKKHNEANGEDSGAEENFSWNCGVEGATDDEQINKLRGRQRRNFLATLFLSQGVPMLCAGDEYGRTQNGNNNAWCQDNELSWLKWERDEIAQQWTEFTANLIHLRRDHPVFRRPKFFQGRKIRGEEIRDIMWFNASGKEMTDAEWSDGNGRTLGMLLSGETMDVRNMQGEPIIDDTFLVLCNAAAQPVDFVLPEKENVQWELLLDTQLEAGFLENPKAFSAGESVPMLDRSLCLLRLKKE